MAIGFNNNDYGITRKEFREFKREMKKLDKGNDQIELTRKDYKEIKTHIKNGDLEAYMGTVGDEMRAALGVTLLPKIDAAKELAESEKMAQTAKLGKDVDVDKVLKYIQVANYPSIAKSIEEGFAPQVKAIETVATIARAETSLMNFDDIVGRITQSHHSNDIN